MSAVDVVAVSKAFGAASVLRDVSLGVPEGTVTALLGPSGCGKTTLLRIVAGLEHVDTGTVSIAGRVVDDGRRPVSPEDRGVGMVFQDWALFPHMSVRKNVGYGLPRADRGGPRVDEVLRMVDLADFGDRAPSTLSGGQQQRVALARALAPRPRVLLLDEPFGSLDTVLRVQVRVEVARLLAEVGISTVFVTHDREEAFVLGDQVAVMDHGRILQVGAPAEIYGAPASAWVAEFVGGANLLDGVVSDGRALTALGPVGVRAGSAQGRVRVLVRPEDLEVSHGSGGRVTLVEYLGSFATIHVDLHDGTRVTVQTHRATVVRGDEVAVRYRGEPAVAYAHDGP